MAKMLSFAESDKIEEQFLKVADSADKVMEFMNDDNGKYEFVLEYFSKTSIAKVTTRSLQVVTQDGTKHEYKDALPFDVQEEIGKNAERIISKGCNAKFSAVLTSMRVIPYFFCQFKFKNVRKTLAEIEFMAQEAVLDMKTLPFEILQEFKAECNALRLFKIEDALTNINSVPKDLSFPAFKYLSVYADYKKGKTVDEQCEHLRTAIVNLPKLFPNAKYLAIVFGFGMLPEVQNVADLIKRVSASMADTCDTIKLNVECVFAHISRGPRSGFDPTGWKFFNYNLQAKKTIKLSTKKMLTFILDPRHGPVSLRTGLVHESEQQNGELPTEWYLEAEEN